jgi:hypothetical protein
MPDPHEDNGLDARKSGATLSSIIPTLAPSDAMPMPKGGQPFALVWTAHVAARYAVEHAFSFEDRKKVKRLFRIEYDKALFAIRDFLMELDLTRDERNRRHQQYESLCERARDLLNGSLETNVVNHDAFNELSSDAMQVYGGTASDAGTWLGSSSSERGISFLAKVEPARQPSYRQVPEGNGRNRRGRKHLTRTEDTKRQGILDRWEGAKGQTSRERFCQDEGITINYLEKCQACIRRRKALSSEQNRSHPSL